MVFAKDFKKDFYDAIQNQRILVLVAFDVDALCAWKILQYLFQCDQVLYTVVPVTGKQDLERAFIDNSEGIKNVLMINCGASQDVVEVLQPEAGVVFYICDSHRPVDVHNLYNQVQVKLLLRQEELDDTVPGFDDVFRDDDDENEDDDSGNDSDISEASGQRKRVTAETLEKRADKRRWQERKNQILFQYTEFSSYGTAAALLMFDMAWKMSKDTNNLLWLAILGVTEQYIRQKVERDTYMEHVEQLQSHVTRHNHRTGDEENSLSIDSLKIHFENDLQLVLYRHWSIYESLCHSENMACKFKIWTLKGKKKLHEFLADMGLPLVQCKQKYNSMDVTYKEEVKEMLGRQCEKYGISDQELFLPSFQAQYGFRNKYCACDCVHICEAWLESLEKDSSPSDDFLKSLAMLDRSNVELMEKGVELVRTQTRAIRNQVQSFLDMNQIISAGPFLYAFLQQGTPDVRVFSKPTCLQRLAKFSLEAYCSVSRNKKAKSLPLVIGAPLDVEMGTMLIIGIPPISDSSCRNCFGKAFETAASGTNSRTQHDSFDAHIMEMKTEDKSKFFDALISLLSD